MKLGLIGCGAIGTDVAKAADKMRDIDKIYMFDIKKGASTKLCKSLKKAEVKPVKDFLEDVDVVFEAASQGAVEEYAEQVIKAGKDLVIMSVGSLFDNKFKDKLEKNVDLEMYSKFLKEALITPAAVKFGIKFAFKHLEAAKYFISLL